MTNEDKLYFKQLLLGQFQELTTKAGRKSASEDWEYFPDPVDRAAFEIGRDLTFRIRDRERRLLRQIKKTLESIEDGTFGICEECGEEIPIPRLKARPMTSLCIACKQAQEMTERMVA